MDVCVECAHLKSSQFCLFDTGPINRSGALGLKEKIYGPGTAKPALRGKIFKNHFLSVFCTTGPILPENIWKMVKNVFYVLSSTLYVHACFYTFTAIYNSWINQVRRTDYSSIASNESLFSSLQNGLYAQPADKSSSMSTIVFSFAGSLSDSSQSSET